MSIVVLSVCAALFTWRGSVLTAVVPVVVVVLVAIVVMRVRRSLRQASSLIDTILREELDAARGPDQQDRPWTAVNR